MHVLYMYSNITYIIISTTFFCFIFYHCNHSNGMANHFISPLRDGEYLKTVSLYNKCFELRPDRLFP